MNDAIVAALIERAQLRKLRRRTPQQTARLAELGGQILAAYADGSLTDSEIAQARAQLHSAQE